MPATIQLKHYRERIDRELTVLELNGEPTELYLPMRYMLGGRGKRARPVLTLMACNLFSGNAEAAVPLALAVELFHNFTLIHDDIMDKAPLRRGRPTVHSKWGHNVAILSGDAMMVKAYQQLSICEPRLLNRILAVFNVAALKVCEGQQMDMNFESRAQVSIVQYIRMIELKTSALLAASLRMGAIAGGATDEQAKALWEFGKNIGIAFQLQDDLLDIYGDESKFGKKLGGDILAGKKTYLLLKALELGDAGVEKNLRALIDNSNEGSGNRVLAARDIFDKLGIKGIALEEVRKFHEAGMAELETLNMPAEKKDVFKNMARELLNREY